MMLVDVFEAMGNLTVAGIAASEVYRPAGARPPACEAKAGGAERPRRAASRPDEIGQPPLSNRGVQ